jgi:hypothetical protein
MNSDTKTPAGGQGANFVLIFWNTFTIMWTAWIVIKVEGDFPPPDRGMVLVLFSGSNSSIQWIQIPRPQLGAKGQILYWFFGIHSLLCGPHGLWWKLRGISTPPDRGMVLIRFSGSNPSMQWIQKPRPQLGARGQILYWLFGIYLVLYGPHGFRWKLRGISPPPSRGMVNSIFWF